MSNEKKSLLRPMLDDDLAMVREWRNAPSIRENMYTSHEISAQEHLTWWERTKASDNDRYLIYEADGVPSGVVSFNGIDRISSHAFWAFYASPDARRGTGSQMEMLALDYAFLELGLRKLSCEVLSFNSRVVKLHQKFGFSVEGIFRAHFPKEGEYYDIYRLGLLSGEWLEIREEIQGKLCRSEGSRQ